MINIFRGFHFGRRSSPVLFQQTRNALFKAGDAGDQNVLQIEHVLHPWLATRSSFNRSMHARPRPFLRTCFREINCSNLISSASLETASFTAKTGCNRKVNGRKPETAGPRLRIHSTSTLETDTLLLRADRFQSHLDIDLRERQSP